METTLICLSALLLIALCSAFYLKKSKPAPVYELPPVQLPEPV